MTVEITVLGKPEEADKVKKKIEELKFDTLSTSWDYKRADFVKITMWITLEERGGG